MKTSSFSQFRPSVCLKPTRDEFVLHPKRSGSAMVFGLCVFAVLSLFSTLALAQFGTWDRRAPIPSGRGQYSAVTLDGMIYVIGGQETALWSRRVDIYDPATDTWSSGPSLPDATVGYAVAAVNGRIHVIGGNNDQRNSSAHWILDPVARVWAAGPAMPTPRVGLRAAVFGGRIYTMGGALRDSSQALGKVEIYDPVSRSWSTGPSMPTPRVDLVVLATAQRIFAIGGSNPGQAQVFSTVEALDLATGTWSTLAPMPTSRSHAVGALLADGLHVFGGLSASGNALSAHEVYDPTLNSWIAIEPLPTARWGLGGATVGNALFALGGHSPTLPGALSMVDRYQLYPLTAGDLDRTFGGGGNVITGIGSGNERAQAVVVQPDQKILAAGFTFVGDRRDFALVRYNPDGSLDRAFGPNGTGKVTTDFGGTDDPGAAVALQPDGKIIVAGSTYPRGPFALVRYHSHGELDTSFGLNGKATASFGGGAEGLTALLVQPDGKIVAVGLSNAGSCCWYFAMVRFSANGSVDTTFGATGNGKVTTDFSGSDDVAHTVALQPDGKFLVAGYANGRSGDGENSDFALARFNINGSLDTSFGTAGKVISDLGATENIYAMAVQLDGKIVVGGRLKTGSNSDFVVARYHSEGSLDTSFGVNGKVTTEFGGNDDRIWALLLQSDGKIVVAGHNDSDFALARYTSNGSLDASFGSAGKTTTNLGATERAYAAGMQADGAIVLAGYSNAAGTEDFALARYLNDTTSPPSTSFVRRQLPSGYTPGAAVTVTLQVTPPISSANHVVEDQPPAGWTVSDVSSGGAFELSNHKVKFGPFFDTTPRTLTYRATAPSSETGEKSFVGIASADGFSSVIEGDQLITPAQFHPADNKPADWIMTASEITAYGAAWKRGDNWPGGPNPIPLGYVSRAGALWKGGESYKLDATVTSGPPLWWVNSTRGGQALGGSDRPIRKSAPQSNSAVSSLPNTYVPGAAITVSITVTPAPDTVSYVVEDLPPIGWTVANLSQGGSFDANNRKVKWGPFFDNTARTLTYQATSPASASGSVSFTGLASFDGADVTVTGQRSTASQASAPALPSVSVTASDATAAEPGTDTGGFTITRTGSTANALTVQLTIAGTASNGSDYQTLSSSVVIAAGATSVLLTVSPVDDSLIEGSETVVVNLAPNASYQLGTSTSATVTIADNDTGPATSGNRAVSSLPANFTPGAALTVSIAVTPNAGVLSYVVEDQPPAGWTVANISQGGSFDSANRKVKWGPFFDNTARTLTYQATAPASASSRVEFSGSASFDGASVVITGERSTTASSAGAPPVTESPSITPISNQLTIWNKDSDLIAFAVDDAKTPPANLRITPASDNEVLIPSRNIQVGPVDPLRPKGRQLVVRPAANQLGTANISLTVTDSDNQTASTRFQVRVAAPPLVHPVGNLTLGPSDSSGINLTIEDPDTFPGFLTVTWDSSNKNVLPNSSFSLSGSGGNQRLTVTALTDREGSSVITLRVVDPDGLAATTTFSVTVARKTVSVTVSAGRDGTVNPSGVIRKTAGENLILEAFAAQGYEVNEWRVNGQLAQTSGSSFTLRNLQQDASVAVTFKARRNSYEFVNSEPILVRDNTTATPYPSRLTVSGVNGSVNNVSVTINKLSHTYTRDLSLLLVGPKGERVVLMRKAGSKKASAVNSLTLTFNDGAANGLSDTALLSTGSYKPTDFAPGTAFPGAAPSAPYATSLTVFNQTDPNGVWTLYVADTELEDTGAIDGGWSLAISTAASQGNLPLPTSPPIVRLPAQGDFNADGLSDLVFQDQGGFLAAWLMDKASFVSVSWFDPKNVGESSYRVVGSADFNQNGQEDLLFQDREGSLAVWLLQGTRLDQVLLLEPSATENASWNVVATSDLNADGKTDLVFQHIDGSIDVWLMDGTKRVQRTATHPSNPGDRNWRVVGAADFNEDRTPDLLFQNAADGRLAIWILNGTTITTALLLNPSSFGDVNARVVSTVDRNQDGKPDLLFQHALTGSLSIWWMDGINRISAQTLNPSQAGGTWRVVAPR